MENISKRLNPPTNSFIRIETPEHIIVYSTDGKYYKKIVKPQNKE